MLERHVIISIEVRAFLTARTTPLLCRHKKVLAIGVKFDIRTHISDSYDWLRRTHAYAQLTSSDRTVGIGWEGVPPPYIRLTFTRFMFPTLVGKRGVALPIHFLALNRRPRFVLVLALCLGLS